jgi:hypothetical protein
VWVIEIVPGLHEEKIIFYRERAANATSTFSSWISIGLPTLFMSFIICAAFGLPAYYLSGLRPDLTHFVIYLSVLYLNVVIHIMIQYLCAALTPNAMIHTLIFPGLAIPYEARLLLSRPLLFSLFTFCRRCSVDMSSISAKCIPGTLGSLRLIHFVGTSMHCSTTNSKATRTHWVM